MKKAVDTYAPLFQKPKILDFGSRMVNKQTLSHRLILQDIDCEYLGIDVVAGPNVDVVMPAPYTIPLENDSVDIIITGQVIEHVPYFWASFMELSRVLKKGGYILCTAPSRGHIHSPPYDCWRYYPDGYKAIASFTGLYLVEASTHWPDAREGMQHFDYSSIPDSEYWGDTLGVFQKPQSYERIKYHTAAKAIEELANLTADLNGVQAQLKKDSLKS